MSLGLSHLKVDVSPPPFFPGILLSGKPPETRGERRICEKKRWLERMDKETFPREMEALYASRDTSALHPEGQLETQTPIEYHWVWLKMKQEGLRRFWSMFPLTRVPFWYRFFEPQPHAKGTVQCRLVTSESIESEMMFHNSWRVAKQRNGRAESCLPS